MDMNVDEQLLLANFRRLGAPEKKELLNYTNFLLEKCRADTVEPVKQDSQCRINHPEERPEAAKEPIFTE